MENEQNTQPAAAPAETPMPALDIVLASASPRRKQLLEDAGVRFVVHASEVDETLEPDLLADPPEACKKLAERKAGAVVQEVLAEDYTGMAARHRRRHHGGVRRGDIRQARQPVRREAYAALPVGSHA